MIVSKKAFKINNNNNNNNNNNSNSNNNKLVRKHCSFFSGDSFIRLYETLGNGKFCYLDTSTTILSSGL